MDIEINKLIITLMKNEEFMYNKQHVDYVRRRENKDNVYEVISQAIFVEFHKNVSAKEIEQRWEMLLLQYKAEKKKMLAKPASGSGAAARVEIWEYYYNFSFMDNCLDHRSVKSSMKRPTSSDSSQPASSLSLNKKVEQENLPCTSSSEPTLALKYKKKRMPQDDAFARKKKKQSDKIDEDINEMKNDLKKAIENIINKEKQVPSHSIPVQSENADWLYVTVYKILVNTPLKYKLDCMIDIQKIVEQYIL